MNPIKKVSSLLTSFFHRVRLLGWGGAFKSVTGKITGKKTIVALRNRPRFLVRAAGSGSDLSVCRQVFDECEYVYHTKKEVRTIVDAGANIGCSAVYFSELFPKARIISIEPSKGNFELLEMNTRDLPQVHRMQAALWPRDVDLEIIDRGEGAWSLQVGEISPAPGDGASSERIPGLTLDEIRKRCDVDVIDILKVDIEGGEREVFAAGGGLLRDVNVLIVETHDRWNPGCTRVVYEATRGFAYEWTQGENIFFCREGWLPENIAPSRIHKIAISH
jgi:FkbM family methyltransferase